MVYRFLTLAAQPLMYIIKGFIVLLGLLPLTQPLCMLFDTDLVALVDPWKLPVMRLLSQVVKVAVGQLSAFSGNLHGETSGDAVGALAVHQSESLEVPWRKDWGHLREHTWTHNQAPAMRICDCDWKHGREKSVHDKTKTGSWLYKQK